MSSSSASLGITFVPTYVANSDMPTSSVSTRSVNTGGNMTQSDRTESILVLGAGELGFEVLRHLARQAQTAQHTRINVLLRPSTANSTAPAKKREFDELKEMGIEIVQGDIVAASENELAATFAPH